MRKACTGIHVLPVIMVSLLVPTAAYGGQDPAALADPRPSPVLSVDVEDDHLVVIAREIGEVQFADGTYGGAANSVVFEKGTIVSVEGRDSYGVKEVSIGTKDTYVDGKSGYEGAIILTSRETAVDKATPNILPDGEYRLEQRRSTGRALLKAAPKPRATGFEVRDGKIVAVFTNGD